MKCLSGNLRGWCSFRCQSPRSSQHSERRPLSQASMETERQERQRGRNRKVRASRVHGKDQRRRVDNQAVSGCGGGQPDRRLQGNDFIKFDSHNQQSRGFHPILIQELLLLDLRNLSPSSSSRSRSTSTWRMSVMRVYSEEVQVLAVHAVRTAAR